MLWLCGTLLRPWYNVGGIFGGEQDHGMVWYSTGDAFEEFDQNINQCLWSAMWRTHIGLVYDVDRHTSLNKRLPCCFGDPVVDQCLWCAVWRRPGVRWRPSRPAQQVVAAWGPRGHHGGGQGVPQGQRRHSRPRRWGPREYTLLKTGYFSVSVSVGPKPHKASRSRGGCLNHKATVAVQKKNEHKKKKTVMLIFHFHPNVCKGSLEPLDFRNTVTRFLMFVTEQCLMFDPAVLFLLFFFSDRCFCWLPRRILEWILVGYMYTSHLLYQCCL